MQRWPSFDPGEMDSQIEIQRQVAGTDKSGAVMTWATFLRCYAAIDPATARDVIRSGQTTAQVEVPIRMQWASGITAGMRVLSGGNTYTVTGIINPGEKNVSLTLMCVALGNNQ